MARRLTTNQEIAGSIPASVTSFFAHFFLFVSRFDLSFPIFDVQNIIE